MNDLIDINFDVESDTPKGKDPDQHSPTLRKFHRMFKIRFYGYKN